MKKFLEEYGFAILIAIVVILLLVMTSPVGNTIKASVINIVDSFGSKTVAKIDKTDKEVITTLKGSELTIESNSETDKYIAILRGYQGGKEVSVASTDDKLICTDNMTNTATFRDATGAAETTNGIARFVIENGTKLDENTKYYIEIMNIGTGEIFKSDASNVDYDKMNTIGGGNSGSGNTLDMSNVDIAGVTGDFSSKGNLVTINSTQYRVLAVNGTRAKVMSMENAGNSRFDYPSVTTSFGSKTGQKYADSTLDQAMTTYYNGLPTAIKSAIVPQTISQSMYSYSVPIHSHNKVAEIEVGQRYVYALDVDDVIEYLGEYSSSSPYVVNKMFFDTDSSVSKDVWLRSAYSDDTDDFYYSAFYADGNYGCLGFNYSFVKSEVRPAFVLDLSLLS